MDFENIPGAKKGPNKRKPRMDGFYETELRRKDGSYFKAVATFDDLEKYNMLTWGTGGKSNYRLHLCYEDLVTKIPFKLF